MPQHNGCSDPVALHSAILPRDGCIADPCPIQFLVESEMDIFLEAEFTVTFDNLRIWIMDDNGPFIDDLPISNWCFSKATQNYGMVTWKCVVKKNVCKDCKDDWSACTFPLPTNGGLTAFERTWSLGVSWMNLGPARLLNFSNLVTHADLPFQAQGLPWILNPQTEGDMEIMNMSLVLKSRTFRYRTVMSINTF